MLKNKFNANTSLFIDSKTFSWFLQNLATYHYFIYFLKIKKLYLSLRIVWEFTILFYTVIPPLFRPKYCEN